jgi:hypothetical protein
MARHDAGLLAEIETDVLSDRPLADALRKCVVLGGKAGSVELRDWATRELRGYRGEDDVPSYRTVAAPVCVDALIGNTQVTGQRLSPRELPEFCRDDIDEEFTFRDGIGQIEALITSSESGAHPGSVHLSLPMAIDIGRVIDSNSGSPFQRTLSLYWSVSTATLRGIVDQVRTTLAELVAEMRAGMPNDADVPSAAVANQAVNVAVHGNKARVTVTSAQTAGEGDATVEPAAPVESPFWTHSRRIGAFVVGLAGIITMVLTYLLWLR